MTLRFIDQSVGDIFVSLLVWHASPIVQTDKVRHRVRLCDRLSAMGFEGQGILTTAFDKNDPIENSFHTPLWEVECSDSVHLTYVSNRRTPFQKIQQIRDTYLQSVLMRPLSGSSWLVISKAVLSRANCRSVIRRLLSGLYRTKALQNFGSNIRDPQLASTTRRHEAELRR
jgi:hypothetical protein